MNIFNKDEFAEILNKAKGDMSINEYANKSRVSAAHISRFLRSMIETPPSPATIKKLADYAHNGIRYEDMLRAAGHLGIQNISVKKITKQDVVSITKEYLFDNNNSWSDKELLMKELMELYWNLKFN